MILTPFQELIVNCKPEIGKPVFMLSGAGSGKSVGLDARAKCVDFLYYKVGDITGSLGYDEVIYEVGATSMVNEILLVSKLKRVIVFVTPIDFVKHFADKLKGEYTIISGFSFQDNPYLQDNYTEYLKQAKSDDMKALTGVWNINKETK